MSREAWHVARAVAASQDWLLTSEQAAECRLTPGELAGAVRRRELRRLYRGVYLFDPDLVQDPPARLLYRAALLSEGDNACLYGVAAARVWKVEGLPAADEAIEVAVIGGPAGRSLPSSPTTPHSRALPP